MDKQAFKLFAILKEISTCCQEREILQAKALNLKPAEARCLIALRLNDIRTTAELAEKMLVAKSRVTRILDGLVKNELVTRREDVEDRRVCVVCLTQKGTKLTDQLLTNIITVHEEVLKILPKSHRDNTVNLLDSLYKAMDTVKSRLDNEQSEKENRLGTN